MNMTEGNALFGVLSIEEIDELTLRARQWWLRTNDVAWLKQSEAHVDMASELSDIVSDLEYAAEFLGY